MKIVNERKYPQVREAIRNHVEGIQDEMASIYDVALEDTRHALNEFQLDNVFQYLSNAQIEIGLLRGIVSKAKTNMVESKCLHLELQLGLGGEAATCTGCGERMTLDRVVEVMKGE